MKIWWGGRGPLAMVCVLWLAAGCDDAANDDPAPEQQTTGDDGDGSTGVDAPMGAESRCDDDDDGPCAGEKLCDAYSCGGRAARFNHFGCERLACSSDADCPSGEACFTLAFERSCEPSVTTCSAQGDACVCEATDDCDGVLHAHCLPTQFYPPEQYCDPSLFSCEELPAWADALERSAENATATLAERLTACAQTARTAVEDCS